MGVALEVLGLDVVEFGSPVIAALILASVESGPAIVGFAVADMELGCSPAMLVFGLVEIESNPSSFASVAPWRSE